MPDKSVIKLGLLDNGTDPSVHRKIQRGTGYSNSNSFEAVGREWFQVAAKEWDETHAKRVIARLENHVFPWLGQLHGDKIDTSLMLTTLMRVVDSGKLDTAKRLRGYCGKIFQYGIVSRRYHKNPCNDLLGVLPTPKTKHFASVTEVEKIGPMLRVLWSHTGSLVVSRAIRLAAYTFVRPGELRKGLWANIDFNAQQWEYVASKTKPDHIVPLSRQSMEILREIHPLTQHSKFIFPNARDRKKPMSDAAVLNAMRSLGVGNDEMTGHGFRAMARTVLDEVHEYKVDWIEHQLAHEVIDANGRAYNRTKYLKQRTEMMQKWADYLDELRLS